MIAVLLALALHHPIGQAPAPAHYDAPVLRLDIQPGDGGTVLMREGWGA
ncbi:hypothetical protein [Nocardia wallacei]|nr:hypothetical protein [Nocardia wallacei]